MYYLLLHSAGAVPLPLNTGTSTVAMSNIVLHSPLIFYVPPYVVYMLCSVRVVESNCCMLHQNRLFHIIG